MTERPARAWLLALFPVALAVAVYGPASMGAGWVADDAVNLAQHAHEGDLLGEWTTPTYAHAGSGKGHIWRPVPATLQHLVALAFGRTGTVFRLLNVALHALNVALVAALARRRGATAAGAAGLAVAFAVHPAVPDAVCWSSDVYDLAAATAVLGVLGVALAPVGLGPRAVGVAALTLVAGLSKESAVAIVPVVAVAVSLTGDGWRRGLALGAASALGAGAYLAWHGAVTAQGYADAASGTPLAHQVQAGLAAIGWLAVLPPRAPMAHLFVPGWGGEVVVGVGTLVVGTGASAWLLRRDRAAAGALLAAGVAWALLLGPAGVGIPFIGVQAVRYAYLPLAAFAVLAAGAGALWPRPRWAVGAAVAWALVSLPRTAPRTVDFAHDGALWSAELQAEPDNPYAAGSLARYLLKQGEDAEALRLWVHAVEAAPPGIRVFDLDQERWLLAQAAFLRGRPDIAHAQVTAYIASLEAQGRPVPGNAWCLTADSLDALGRPKEAEDAALLCGP